MTHLIVTESPKDEWYRDIVRIHHSHLPKGVSKGDMVIVRYEARAVAALLRGNSEPGQIMMDGAVRKKFGVSPGDRIGVQIVQASLLGKLRWAWTANDPAYRLAAQMGLAALLLGILAVLLTIPPLVDMLEKSRWF